MAGTRGQLHMHATSQIGGLSHDGLRSTTAVKTREDVGVEHLEGRAARGQCGRKEGEESRT